VATFVLMSDGIPIIYQGQEQHLSGGTNPYTNREALWETGLNVFAPLYQHIATLNTLRRHIIATDSNFTMQTSSVIHQSDEILVLRRGDKDRQVVTVLTNGGTNATDLKLALGMSETGFSSGTLLTDVLSCTNYTVDSTGSIALSMSAGLPLVLYPATSLQNSSLCGTGGLRFAEGHQTVTATTYTSTVNAAATVMVSTATVPIATVSATTSSSQTAVSGVGLQATSSSALVFVAIVATTLGSAFIGSLLLFAE